LKIRHLELGLQVTSEAFDESKNNSKFFKKFKQRSNCCLNAKKRLLMEPFLSRQRPQFNPQTFFV
jgi:hypothetical protein